MELINKEEVMKLQTYLLAEGEHEKLVMLSDVMAIQTVDAVPVRHGRWIPVTNGRGGFECSRCHSYSPSFRSGDDNLSPYCPHCGAKMEADDEA